jgi:hypothetical protein
LGVDYTLLASNYDYTAMSDAVLYATAHSLTFFGIIAQSIHMVRPTIEAYRISVAYTTFMVDIAAYDPDGYGPEPTNALMASMLDRIQTLESSFNPVTDIASQLLSGIHCLPEDLTGLANDNWIDDERHYVNSTHSEQVIRCSAGSIYRHGLTITKEIDGVALVEGTDYIVFGVDHAKTTASYHPSGVYDYICITKRAIVGVLVVKYHAYGGEFTDLDGNALKSALGNILRYLQTLGFNDGTGTNICAALGDVHTLHTVTALDTQYHWLTIAKLYRDAGLIVLRKAVGMFRIYAVDNLKCDVLFRVDLDLDRTQNIMKTELIAGLNPINWTSETYDADVVNQNIPQVRCVWADGIDSGIYLQFGFPIRPVAIASLVVENHSSTASGWTLTDGSIVTHGVQDDALLLPDGNTAWVTGKAQDQVQRILGYKDGITLFSGYFEVDNDGVDLPDMTVYSTLLGTDVPLWAVSTVEFTIYDRYNNSTFRHTAICQPKLTSTYNTFSVRTLFDPRDLCGLGMNAYLDIGNNLVTMLIPVWVGSHSLGAGMLSNPVPRFAITSIKVMF